MLKRDLVINRYFPDLLVYTKEDKNVLQEIFVRHIKSKVEKSNRYIRAVIYSKNVRIIDKTHKFYHEYRNLKIGTLNWFETLSKSFRSYIGWFLQNKYMFELNVNSNVPEYLLVDIERKCQNEVVSRFYDEYLDENGIVNSDVLNDFYFKRKLEENYYDKLFKLYRYILEENKLDYLNEDGTIKENLVLDYCIFDEKIPSSLQEKIRVSVGRTKENFDALAKANCEKFKYFVTLTFADEKEKEKHIRLNDARLEDEYNLAFIYVKDIASLECCNHSLHVFFTSLKRDLKKDGIEFYYLGCPEYHNNGHVHYHFLFSDLPNKYFYKVPRWLDFDNVTKKYQNGFGLVNWKYGKSDIQPIKDEYKVTTYIAKYIEKSLEEIDGTVYFERLNKKRYFASNNLEKPVVDYSSIEEIDFEFNSVYVHERKSSFNENEIVDILYSI